MDLFCANPFASEPLTALIAADTVRATGVVPADGRNLRSNPLNLIGVMPAKGALYDSPVRIVPLTGVPPARAIHRGYE